MTQAFALLFMDGHFILVFYRYNPKQCQLYSCTYWLYPFSSPT